MLQKDNKVLISSEHEESVFEIEGDTPTKLDIANYKKMKKYLLNVTNS